MGRLDAYKRITPDAGKLYGFLSEKTHIDYRNHGEFLTVENGRNMVLKAHVEHLEYATVILQLADLFGIIWEYSQAPFIDKFEALEKNNNRLQIREDRPFLMTMSQHLEDLENAMKRTR